MNEPFYRVSQNNNEITNSLIGGGIGAGLVGSGMLGARAHYNGIDKRLTGQIEKAQTNLKTELGNLSNYGKQYRELGLNPESKPEAVQHAKDMMYRSDQNVDRIDRGLEKLKAPGVADQRRAGHVYPQMKGWKGAAAVGAGAAIGAGIGYLGS